MTDLADRLLRIACSPVLLVASDYDGTLAPIVNDPEKAFPDREVLVALNALAAMPQTHVAVISGRGLGDLARLIGDPGVIHLVGSHGSEFDLGFAERLSRTAERLRDRIGRELESIARDLPGARIESKPASVAFHYREVDEDRVAAALEAVRSGPASRDRVHVKEGKKVLELCVVSTDKGDALETIRHRVGATAAVFLGDDRTDEDAFAGLRGPDLGIKVGEGTSRAPFRVADVREVARTLAMLAERRAAWLAGSEAVPIEAHGMLSDGRTVALLAPDARVVWCCLPRIDSPALFAELVGGPNAGHFAVVPEGEVGTPEQRYTDGTCELRTAWGDVTVTDYLDCSGGRPAQRAGRTDLVRVIEGSGRVRIEFAPRLDFGRTPTGLRIRDGGVEVEDTPDPIVLRARGVDWTLHEEGPHQTARAVVDLDESSLVLELRYGTGDLADPVVPEMPRRRQTARFWTAWGERLVLPGRYTETLRRSAVTLKALCHGPTGAIAAAATTSLPEHRGGVRNWDYRYCWIRDAAMSAGALVRLGSTTEGMQFLDWLLHVLDRTPGPERLRPIYTVTGGELGPEAEIPELSGYAGSRPVRVGNAAAHQVQLDVFGPVVELVDALLERGAPLSADHWRLVEAMVTAVERRWTEPDHGIWEIRGRRRHYVHSKTMCWRAVDLGVGIARRFLDREMPEWEGLRDRIAAEVLDRGWSEEAGAFTAAYGWNELDAAVLLTGLSGMVGPDDERFRRTVGAVERELLEEGTVYRYRFDDGLPGIEGGFHLATGWLARAYLYVGRRDDARKLIEGTIAAAGPTGLLPEEVSPRTGRGLGNHPQAYSHLAVIHGVLDLLESETG